MQSNLDVVFSDQCLLVINKPAGIIVSSDDTERDNLLAKIQTAISAASLVHRIDKDTSGVMVVAKNLETRDLLQTQFKDRRVNKEYLAVLDGNLSSNYTLKESYLARNRKNRMQMQSHSAIDQSKNYRFARSEFFVLQRFHNRLNLAKVKITTGRTHQIRVHAKALGTPVLGDKLYHRPTTLPQTFPEELRNTVFNLQRQMLHASMLEFFHPYTGKPMCFTVPPPSDFATLVDNLSKSSPQPLERGVSAISRYLGNNATG